MMACVPFQDSRPDSIFVVKSGEDDRYFHVTRPVVAFIEKLSKHLDRTAYHCHPRERGVVRRRRRI